MNFYIPVHLLLWSHLQPFFGHFLWYLHLRLLVPALLQHYKRRASKEYYYEKGKLNWNVFLIEWFTHTWRYEFRKPFALFATSLCWCSNKLLVQWAKNTKEALSRIISMNQWSNATCDRLQKSHFNNNYYYFNCYY